MKPLLIALLLFALFPAASVHASASESDANAPYNIVEATAISVTVSVTGSSVIDSAKTFKITDATKITIDNQPASGTDLKRGMVAEIKTAVDGNTALYINAHVPRQM